LKFNEQSGLQLLQPKFQRQTCQVFVLFSTLFIAAWAFLKVADYPIKKNSN